MRAREGECVTSQCVRPLAMRVAHTVSMCRHAGFSSSLASPLFPLLLCMLRAERGSCTWTSPVLGDLACAPPAAQPAGLAGSCLLACSLQAGYSPSSCLPCGHAAHTTHTALLLPAAEVLRAGQGVDWARLHPAKALQFTSEKCCTRSLDLDCGELVPFPAGSCSPDTCRQPGFHLDALLYPRVPGHSQPGAATGTYGLLQQTPLLSSLPYLC